MELTVKGSDGKHQIQARGLNG